MKNSAVVTVNTLLNLSELGIEGSEICWNKVKMTSSRWITCCHRKLKKSRNQNETIDNFRYSSEHKSEHTVIDANGRNSAYSGDGGGDLYTTTITRKMICAKPSRNGHSNRSPIDSKRSNCLRNSSQTHSNQLDNPSEYISSSYQTNEHSDNQHSSNFRNFPNGFCSSSISSQFTPSSASPVSGSSIYERKSSASSSASSNHSSYSATVGNVKDINVQQLHSSHFVTTLMRHSKSNIDLNDHCTPYSPNNYSHSLSRSCSKYRDSILKHVLTVENTITIINPRDGALISCQTDEDSNCAQISPQINVIAVSNEYWIAFYSILTNERLGVLELPLSCSYWTWISADTVAVVSRGEVFHWSLPNNDADSNCIRAYDRKRLVFEVDNEISSNQIINYTVDPLFGNWCALSTLYLDEFGDVEGKVQIYSHLNKQSQCIQAHSCSFTSYKFEDSNQPSTMLIAAKREKDRRWKLHIIELGPIPDGNISHRPISNALHHHSKTSKNNKPIENDDYTSLSADIPTHIACDSSIGLIYLLSKYGSFYICDIETGVPLYYDNFNDLTAQQPDISSALFTFSYDQSTSSLLSVSRAGLVLTFHVSLDKLLSTSRKTNVASKILERIQKRCNAIRSKSSSSRPSSVTKHLQQFEQTFEPLTDSNYSSSPTTSELESSTQNISSPHPFHYGDKIHPHDDEDDDDEAVNDLLSVDGNSFNIAHHRHQHSFNGTTRPQPIYVESDLSEEVTRL